MVSNFLLETIGRLKLTTDVEYDNIDETEIECDSIGNDFDQRMKVLEAVLSQNKKKLQHMIT